MSITVTWDSPDKIAVRLDFPAEWTWQDLTEAFNEDDAYFDSVEYTVHMILNMKDIQMVPPNPMKHLRGIAQMITPQLGLVIMVGNSIWAQTVMEIFFKAYGQRASGLTGVESVEDLEQARQIIARNFPAID